MANRKWNIVDLERRKTEITPCGDEPCERLLSVEDRIERLEDNLNEELKNIRSEIRRSRSHTTKSVSSITAVATIIAAILSSYQAKPSNPDDLRETVKRVLIEQTKEMK